MSKHTYIIDVDPVAKGRPRFTKAGRAYTPQKTKQFSKDVKEYMEMYFIEKLEGALHVDLTFFIKRPKTVRRKYPTVKPDIDNFEKAIYDALNEILWHDDCQIVSHNVAKKYSTTPEGDFVGEGIHIKIEKLT
jgi:Holliday junction resolvase RusA-like endonuclease